MQDLVSELIGHGLWGTSAFAGMSLLVALVLGIRLGARRLRTRGDKRHAFARTVLDSSLVGSIALIISMTLFPVTGWGGWSQIGVTDTHSVNLVPLETISLFLKWGSDAQLMHNVVNNILLFVPLGICLALKARRSQALLLATLGGVALSAFVEGGQLLLPIGRSTDVDDVILNSLGAFLGAGMALMVLPGLRWLAHSRDARGSRNRVTA